MKELKTKNILLNSANLKRPIPNLTMSKLLLNPRSSKINPLKKISLLFIFISLRSHSNPRVLPKSLSP
jgi:hypothetical protein